MVIIGLTGGSGSGKTTLCEILAQRGVYIINADEVSRRVQAKGMPALGEIREAFGNEVFEADGALNRKKLGEIVFTDKDKLRILNKITHKYITEEIERELKTVKEDIVILDAPALIESGAMKMCDTVIALVADRELRAERIMARDGLTREQAQARIAAQRTDASYTQYADMVVDNSGDEALEVLADDILRKIGGRLTSER